MVSVAKDVYNTSGEEMYTSNHNKVSLTTTRATNNNRIHWLPLSRL